MNQSQKTVDFVQDLSAKVEGNNDAINMKVDIIKNTTPTAEFDPHKYAQDIKFIKLTIQSVSANDGI